MNTLENSVAFGAPGIEPHWTSREKEGIGTAYHTSCQLWFTLSHGIVNEIYYPHVDATNTRDFEFLITDGETFCHEEKRDLDHQIEYPERDCVFYRLTNSDRQGRYRLVKHVLADPHHPVLLQHTRVEVLDESLRGKLRFYALLAPHLARYGAGNSGNRSVAWSTDGWAHTNKMDTSHQSGLNLWFADLPAEDWPEGAVLEFTCFWKADQRWQGHNWRVSVVKNQTKRVERRPRLHERKSSMHLSGTPR